MEKLPSYQSKNFNTSCNNNHCPHNFKGFCQIPIDQICPKDKTNIKSLKGKFKMWEKVKN